MRAHAEVAPEHELVIHEDVHTVVSTGIHVDCLRPRQEPEPTPLDAKESPR
jgi:hypothetical protein